MSNYFGAQPSSPFYAQQQQLPLHTNHGAPPPQHQQQQPSYSAVSPVSAQSYSPSPPQQAPLRPHTTAPYAGSGFAPPPSAGPAGYYQQFPPQQPQQQQSQQGYRPQQQQPQQAASDYGGLQQTQQPRNDYAPTSAAPAPPAPSTGYPSDIPRLASSHGVSPEVVQKLAADLMRSIQQSNISSPTVAPVGPPPRLDHPALPGGAPAPGMGQPPPQQPPMMQQQQPSQIHIPGSFPSYPPAPAPQEPPQVPHHQYRQQQQQQQPQGYPPQPQGYFPPQPIPAPNPSAPPAPTTADSKGPPPSGPVHPPMQQRQNDGPRRDTSQRYRSNTTSTHHSHTSTPATSTSSGPAGKDGSILYELWGDLVDQELGREPMPKEKLVRLFREIANYIIKERAPAESIVITPDKMVDFYVVNAVEGDDRMDWKGYFNNRTDSSLSNIYRVLGCEHFYVPTSREQKPTIPALTPQGFETWMFTQLMTHPSREAARIQKVVASWPIHDTKEGRRFPKSIPRRCFPEKEDTVIFQGWWRVWEEFPPDFEEEEEEPAPLTLPAPGDSSGNRYYGPPPLHGPLPGPGYATAPMARKGTQQKYPPNPRDLNDDELDAIIESGKDKSPPIERHRKPYASSTGNPGWKEELNPRPTLGEDKASSTRNGPPPPSRPHTSHGHHPSRDAREFREEPYAKPGPDRDPRDPRDPGDPRDPRNPRDPRDPREPREPRDPRDPREPRDPRDLSDSPETPLGRSKSTRRGHQRERSQYRHSHRHSHSHHRGGGRRDRSADEHDQEWSGSSGVSAQTPISVPDAGVPISGAAPAPPPLEPQDRRSRAQRKADEAARVARQQEDLLRGFGPSGRYEPPADPYEYDDFTAPPPGRGRERDDRRVAEYAYQDEYDRDRRAQQPGGGPGGRRSSHHLGDRGRARDRSSYWGGS